MFECYLSIGISLGFILVSSSVNNKASANAVETAREGYGGYGGYGNGGYGNGGYYMSGGYGGGGLSSLTDILTGVLATLAGLALLAALAVALAAPLAFFIGRKKRDVLSDLSPQVQSWLADVDTLQQFINSTGADALSLQPKRIIANYLTCSGLAGSKNQCMERVVCEYSNSSEGSQLQTAAMNIIYNTLKSNEFLSPDFRLRLKNALKQGTSNKDCKIFTCRDKDF